MTAGVLIVGAASPLGRSISVELRQLGLQTTGTSRQPREGFERLDVADGDQSQQLLERLQPDTVIYLARPDLTNSTNAPLHVDSAVQSLRRFATQCSEQSVRRFIFASSAAVYGTAGITPRTEADQVSGISHYAALKLRSESVLAQVNNSTSLSVLALRIFNIFGPGFASSLVNRLSLGADPPPLVHNTEHFVRDYIHVADVARAFALSVDADNAVPMVVNVGTGLGTSNTALLAMIPAANYQTSIDFFGSSTSVGDISLIRTLWDFEPRVTLERAIRSPGEFLS